MTFVSFSLAHVTEREREREQKLISPPPSLIQIFLRHLTANRFERNCVLWLTFAHSWCSVPASFSPNRYLVTHIWSELLMTTNYKRMTMEMNRVKRSRTHILVYLMQTCLVTQNVCSRKKMSKVLQIVDYFIDIISNFNHPLKHQMLCMTWHVISTATLHGTLFFFASSSTCNVTWLINRLFYFTFCFFIIRVPLVHASIVFDCSTEMVIFFSQPSNTISLAPWADQSCSVWSLHVDDVHQFVSRGKRKRERENELMSHFAWMSIALKGHENNNTSTYPQHLLWARQHITLLN